MSAALVYYLGLGSNVGDRERNLRSAWEMLAPHCESRRLSSLYESEPMYVTEQPLFLNAVGEATSSLDPARMLDIIHEVEMQLGRDRSRERRNGPRTVDIDILLCGALVMDTPDLVIPHPRIGERGFVLIPLLELAPELRDPRTGARYAEMLPGAAGGVYSYPPR